jgi:hypothetical protein
METVLACFKMEDVHAKILAIALLLLLLDVS